MLIAFIYVIQLLSNLILFQLLFYFHCPGGRRYPGDDARTIGSRTWAAGSWTAMTAHWRTAAGNGHEQRVKLPHVSTASR